MLDGWLVISCLGDNHAGAVGCELCSDRMMVVSAGTSGTVVRVAYEGGARLGKTAVFEYYDEELLLSMLPHCASWYEQFAKERHPGKDFRQIDREMELHIEDWTRHPLSRIPVGAITDGKGQDSAVDTANIQASIALELLLLVKKMLKEVTEPDSDIDTIVLTGGLSRSPFFQEVMRVGVSRLGPGLELRISAHEGPLAHKAAALGAVINAIIGSEGGEISKRIADLCPTAPVPARFYMPTVIESFLKENL
jgi:sugar (pentulose or hexulose) kinase